MIAAPVCSAMLAAYPITSRVPFEKSLGTRIRRSLPGKARRAAAAVSNIGIGQRRSILSATDPSAQRSNPFRPCVPIAKRSERTFFNTSRICTSISPILISVVAATPFFCALSFSFGNSRFALSSSAVVHVEVVIGMSIKDATIRGTTCRTWMRAPCNDASWIAESKARKEAGEKSTGQRIRLNRNARSTICLYERTKKISAYTRHSPAIPVHRPGPLQSSIAVRSLPTYHGFPDFTQP